MCARVCIHVLLSLMNSLDFVIKHFKSFNKVETFTPNISHGVVSCLDAAVARFAVTRDLVVTEFTYLQFDIAMGCFYSERCYG